MHLREESETKVGLRLADDAFTVYNMSLALHDTYRMPMTMRNSIAPLAVLRGFRTHDYSLNDFLAARVEAIPKKEALVFEGARWTYQELQRDIERAAALFRARGVTAGDRIGLLSTNHPTTLIAMFALASLGAVMTPANPNYTATEAGYVFRHAAVTGLIVSPETAAVGEQATQDMDRRPWILLNEASGQVDAPVLQDLLGKPNAEINDLRKGAAESTALIIYTSGTTGSPKGVQHGQRGIVITGESFVGRLRLQNDDRILCVMPLFHINALMYSVCGAIAAGATLVLARRFSAGGFWMLVADERVTEVNLVPAPVNILLSRPRSEYRPGHALKKMFVAPATASMIQALRDRFEVEDVIECYGMTEIPGLFANPFDGRRKPASMGIASPHPDPNVETPIAKIIDEAGDPVARGVTGQLVVRTPTMMQGYFRAPEETAAAVRDGWFYTGDLVWQDHDGFFFYAGRMKDIIRRHGENISGVELDRALGEHPEIADVAVIAVPSPLGEDDIMIVASRRAGSDLDARRLGDWARARLSPSKRPRYVVMVDSLPYTPTQRVEKHKLRKDASLRAKALDLQYENG